MTIMNLQVLGQWLAVTMFSIVLGVSQSAAQTIGRLFQMMGGMDTVSKLSSSLLQSSASDPRLAGLLGKANVSAASPKLADQMCSMLGGGCKAPLTDQQIAAGASKLDASQTKALGDNFSSALGNVTSNPLVKEGVSKAIPGLSARSFSICFVIVASSGAAMPTGARVVASKRRRAPALARSHASARATRSRRRCP